MKETPEKARRRERILAAATTLWSTRGFPEVSFDDIASEAGVSRRTLYNHFQDKQELYREMALPILSSALQRLERESTAEDFPANVVRLCAGLWDEFGASARIINTLRLDDLPDLAQIHQDFIRRFGNVFESAHRRSGLAMEPHRAALLTFRTFIPALETLNNLPNRDEAYRNMLEAAFLR